MVEKLKEYLNQDIKDRDYDEGLLLLVKLSKNRILRDRLSRKPWPDKLFYELEKILDKKEAMESEKSIANENTRAAAKKTKQNKSIPSKKSIVLPGELSEKSAPNRIRVIKGDQKINYEDLPEVLQQKWDENATLYKQGRSYHEKLKLMGDKTDEERAPIVQELSKISKLIRANWDTIDSWDGTFPLPGGTKPIDHKRISANRKYISSNLKKMEDNPGNTQLFSKIQERITELVNAKIEFSTDQVNRLKSLNFQV